MNADDPLAAYNKRRRPPMDTYCRHSPVHGGAGYLRPDEPRGLEEWDDFAYQVVGPAPDLASVQRWVAELALDDDSAA